MFVGKPGRIDYQHTFLQFMAPKPTGRVAVVSGISGFSHYLYTTGNNQRGYPELLLFCSKRDRCIYGPILQRLSQFMYETTAIPHPHRQMTFQRSHFYPLWVDGVFVRRYAKLVSPYVRSFPRMQMLQLLVPDSSGNYPHEPNYDKRFLTQPILERH